MKAFQATNQSFTAAAKHCAVACIMALALVAICVLLMSGCQIQGAPASSSNGSTQPAASQTEQPSVFSLKKTSPYSGSPSVEVNGGIPYFAEDELTLMPLEEYSDLDSLGRCGVAVALVGPETIPTKNRGSIGMIKPSGWQISEYDWIDGKYLFNRCHLVAYSLAAENDNPLNLITGTRTMNAQGMLPYEEQVATYVRQTGNHVLYRVTPVFEGDNLVASGVLMEARSVEDGGSGVRFCVWCYNVEPGVVIDYATGDNRPGDPAKESFEANEGAVASATYGGYEANLDSRGGRSSRSEPTAEDDGVERSQDQLERVQTYVLNMNTHRFHYPDCPSVSDMKEENKQAFEGTREEAIEQGYRPCGVCNP